MIRQPNIISIKNRIIPIKLTLIECKDNIFKIENIEDDFKIYYNINNIDFSKIVHMSNIITSNLKNKIIKLLENEIKGEK